jgi:AraC family transcriptional regulator
VALVNGYALRQCSLQTYRGGLGSARLRRIKEFVQAKIEDDLTLCEMAQSVELSTAYFSRMFRKSTGETPHQFLLRQRIERATEMLRSADARVMDVAVACGFKSQQHFAQVFRHLCGASPTCEPRVTHQGSISFSRGFTFSDSKEAPSRTDGEMPANQHRVYIIKRTY